MGEYKNQHTVTAAYLRGFAADDFPNSLWRYDKADGSCRKSNIDRASVKFYAYSFRDKDGKWNHDVEKLLGQIESLALPLLPKLEAGSLLTETEKNHLSYFIGVMMRRSGALLDHFRKEISEYMNDRARQLAFIDGMMPELQKRFSPDEIEFAKRKIEDGEFDVSHDIAKAGQLDVWLKSIPRYAQTLAYMHWQIWQADSGCNFVTSDAPAFVRRHAHDEDLGIVGIARADLGAELTFPVSKKSLLVAKHTPCKAVEKATKTRVRELNSLIIRMAHEHIFAMENSPSLTCLVTQNKGFAIPLPDFSGVREKIDRQYNSLPDRSMST
jgi:hypothetical protein